MRRNFRNLGGELITLEVVRDKDFVDEIQEISLLRGVFNARKWTVLTAVFYSLFLLTGLSDQPSHQLLLISCILTIIVFTKYSFSVKKETLLIISSIGVQFTTTFATGRTSSKFMLLSSVKDIAVNEYISLCSVVYCLILLTESLSTEFNIFPLFQGTKPRLDCIQEIYSRAKVHISRIKCKSTKNNSH